MEVCTNFYPFLFLKWKLIHPFYKALVIFFNIALFMFPLSLIFCSKVRNWAFSNWPTTFSGLASVSTFLGFTQRKDMDENKFINDLFIQFNARYDKLNNDLNMIREKYDNSSKILEEKDKLTLYDYFNLFSEQYMFYKRGFVYPECWIAWAAGMKTYYNNKKIQELWKEECKEDSYYGFDIEAVLNVSNVK